MYCKLVRLYDLLCSLNRGHYLSLVGGWATTHSETLFLGPISWLSASYSRGSYCLVLVWSLGLVVIPSEAVSLG
jgi:hypothetical protein